MQQTKKFLFVSLTSLMIVLGLSFFNILGFSISNAILSIAIAGIAVFILDESNYEFELMHLVLGILIVALINIIIYGLEFNKALFYVVAIPFILPFFAIKIRKTLVKN